MLAQYVARLDLLHKGSHCRRHNNHINNNDNKVLVYTTPASAYRSLDCQVLFMGFELNDTTVTGIIAIWAFTAGPCLHDKVNLGIFSWLGKAVRVF